MVDKCIELVNSTGTRQSSAASNGRFGSAHVRASAHLPMFSAIIPLLISALIRLGWRWNCCPNFGDVKGRRLQTMVSI